MTSLFIPPDAVHPDLKKMQNWLAWRLVQKSGAKKPSKIPYYLNGAPRPGAQGTAEDRAQLATYDQAVAMVAASHGHYTGIGFAVLPGDGIVALDYDNCIDRRGVVDARVANAVRGTYSEVSPSGTGIRAFMRGHLQSKKDTKGERAGANGVALEVFGHNGFVTVTGNLLPECEMFGYERVLLDVTPEVLSTYIARWGNDGAVQISQPGGEAGDLSGTDTMTGLVAGLGWTADVAKSVLASLDPSTDRERWLKVGMALHHEFQGSEVGLNLYDSWSAGGGSYAGREDVLGRWKSFGKGSSPTPVTAKWLLSWRKEAVARTRYDQAAAWRKQVASCLDEFVLREKICPMVSKDDLGELERETIAQALCDRFRGLGSKYPIAQCRKLIAPAMPTQISTGSSMPDWVSCWVYVTDQDKYYRMDSDEWLSKQGFNARFNRMMPVDENGMITQLASDAATNTFQIPSATRGMYLPWGGATFEMHGVDCVNTYRPSSVPQAAETVSADGQRIINLVIEHITMLCGGRKDVADNLVAWLAHNVQKPGVKIRWAPLIKGVEGDGKTLFGHFAEVAMGSPNIKNISPTVLGTDFSDWGHGACIGILEEIKLTGHNKYDILNKIKPNITNNSVPVHPKGSKEFTVINTMNYVAFTNFSDSLPLSDTDRRWMIVFTPFSHISQLVENVTNKGWENTGAYFDKLYQGVIANRAYLRRWLLDYEIPDTFRPDGSAPFTLEKAQMVAMSSSPEEDLVMEAYEEKGVGIGPSVLSSACLTAACSALDPDTRLATTTVNRVLSRLGWVKLAKKIKWSNRAHTVWTKGEVPSCNDGIRELLDDTLKNTSDFCEKGSKLEEFDQLGTYLRTF